MKFSSATLFVPLILHFLVSVNGQSGQAVDPEAEFDGLDECPQGSDDEINECLRGLLQDIRPFLAKGIPQLGVPPLEPFRIGEETKAKILGMEYTWKNAAIHEFSKYTTFEMKVNTKRRTVDVAQSYKYVRVTADYTRGGHFLGFPLRGSGKLQMELYNYRANGTFFLDVTQAADGARTLKVRDVDYDNYFDRVRFTVPGLHPIGQLWLRWLNRNAVTIYNFVLRGPIKNFVQKYLTTWPTLQVALLSHWIPTVFPLTEDKEAAQQQQQHIKTLIIA